MRACFFVDTIMGMAPYKDSSLDMMMEAQARGHEVWAAQGFHGVSAGTDTVLGKAQTVHFADHVRDTKALTAQTTTLGELTYVDLATMDVIFIRNDPPFGMDYLSMALLLSPLEGKVQFINRPSGLRVISEKLSALHFPAAAPATLASYDVDALRQFAEQHEKVVLKPAYFGAGTGVMVSAATDPDFDTHVQTILTLAPRGPVIAQGFLPEVVDGDTRVMMLDGEVIAALGRKPPEGDFRANIAMGGTEFAVDLSAKQRAVAAEIGPFLVAHGIIYAGLDFIGDHLIEINVTSPTLIQELRRVGGPDMSQKIWDYLETQAKT